MKIVIYDTTNPKDKGYIYDYYMSRIAAIAVASDINRRNLISDSCEIAVIED